MYGTRMPPSSRSIFLPTSGQVSEKRSPPLSLVKTTSVFFSSFSFFNETKIRPIPSSICRIMVRYVSTEPPSKWKILLGTCTMRFDSASSSRVSHGQCGAL